MKKLPALIITLLLILSFSFNVFASQPDEGPGEGYTIVPLGYTLVKTYDTSLDPYYAYAFTTTDADGVEWYVTYGDHAISLRASDCTLQDYLDIRTDNETRKNVIFNAFQKLGLNYRYGCSGPTAYDCSGFLRVSMNESGLDVPRSSYSVCGLERQIPIEELQPGDILATGGHVGIYAGDNVFIHAQDGASGIVTDYLDIYNNLAIHKFRRYINIID